MPKKLIDDELWSLIEPLLPERAPHNLPYPGRKSTADHAVLTGIAFMFALRHCVELAAARNASPSIKEAIVRPACSCVSSRLRESNNLPLNNPDGLRARSGSTSRLSHIYCLPHSAANSSPNALPHGIPLLN